jgi:predicted enzyme related to lactoylglutathione lyase
MATKAPLVRGVDFVYLPSRDFDAAEAFYGGVLGLPMRSYGEQPGGEFETGNLTLQVLQADAFGLEFHPAPNPIALRVDDVEAARSALEAQGIAFKGDTMDSGVCHMAFFEDPDGNVLVLHHRYAPRTR